MDNTLRDLCYLLEDEVKKIVDKQDISPEELDMVYKAVKTMVKAKEYESMNTDGPRMNRPQGYYPGGEWNAQGYYGDYDRTHRHMGYGYR